MNNRRVLLKNILVILFCVTIAGCALGNASTVLPLSMTSKSALNLGLSAVSNASNGATATPNSTPTPPGSQSSDTNKVSSSNAVDKASSLDSLSFPIRAAFYYPWFPEAWTQQGMYPYTNYKPTLGYYDQSDPTIIKQQINALLYGNIQAGIASWWGQGTATDKRFPSLLNTAADTTFKWGVYYEPEGVGNPDVSKLKADLVYLKDKYGSDPAYLRIDNRFVVFVYEDVTDGCAMVDRWQQANTVNAYIVLKVFPGYQKCANQPDGWHQYSPAKAEVSLGQYSYTISPGFWKAGKNPQLARDPVAWKQDISNMVASGANFQLITSFNEWGEGTAVESADQWATSSGYGAYLDALHNIGPATTTVVQISTSTPGADPVVIAAGDIADCSSNGDQQTAALIDKIGGTVITLGDNAYGSGTASQFTKCYAPTWGTQKARTFPSVGNHEYLTKNASGYFNYFGAAAGDPQKGYYSYDLGAWHIVVINANCSQIGGCGVNSPQGLWLSADLAAHPALCTLAYWHQPRFSSGEHGNDTELIPIWQLLYNAGAELVLNGHDHDYERFAPQDPNGNADPSRGIREFIVGTGGKGLRPINSPIANSVAQNDNTFGVLKLTLHPTGYDWQFVPVAGQTFTDSGSGVCH
jgi:hypothetical protein